MIADRGRFWQRAAVVSIMLCLLVLVVCVYCGIQTAGGGATDMGTKPLNIENWLHLM